MDLLLLTVSVYRLIECVHHDSWTNPILIQWFCEYLMHPACFLFLSFSAVVPAPLHSVPFTKNIPKVSNYDWVPCLPFTCICMSLQLPQMFPGLLMNLQVYTRESPLFSFQPCAVKLDLKGAVKAFAIQPNGTQTPLFKLNIVSIIAVWPLNIKNMCLSHCTKVVKQ